MHFGQNTKERYVESDDRSLRAGSMASNQGGKPPKSHSAAHTLQIINFNTSTCNITTQSTLKLMNSVHTIGCYNHDITSSRLEHLNGLKCKIE